MIMNTLMLKITIIAPNPMKSFDFMKNTYQIQIITQNNA